MDWKNDPEVMDAFHRMATLTKDALNEFLNAIGKHNDGTPLFAFLQIYGVFVNRYCDHSSKETETDSFGLALAEVANHPTVQRMVASMMRQQIDRGLGV